MSRISFGGNITSRASKIGQGDSARKRRGGKEEERRKGKRENNYIQNDSKKKKRKVEGFFFFFFGRWRTRKVFTSKVQTQCVPYDPHKPGMPLLR